MIICTVLLLVAFILFLIKYIYNLKNKLIVLHIFLTPPIA